MSAALPNPSANGTVLALEARGMCAGYGPQPVIRDLDISVGRGEIVALLGANGAGKTTTLLGLAGELPLESGSVHLDGEDAGGAPLHARARRGLAFVTEERSVFSQMSTMDNIRVGSCDEGRVLAMFPVLAERAQVRGGLLSGGEQQMLSLGRAIAREPKVLLADELSLGLAPLIVDQLLQVVRSEADQRGMGVVLVEQHVRKVLKYADRFCVMRRGEIVAEGAAVDSDTTIEEIERAYIAGDSASSSKEE